MSRMIATRTPVYGTDQRHARAGSSCSARDWAMFPLSSDGVRVDQCLEIEDWTKGSPTARFDDDTITWRAVAFE